MKKYLEFYDLYVQDKKRWACTAMTYVSMSRIQELEEAARKSIKIIHPPRKRDVF